MAKYEWWMMKSLVIIAKKLRVYFFGRAVCELVIWINYLRESNNENLILPRLPPLITTYVHVNTYLQQLV